MKRKKIKRRIKMRLGGEKEQKRTTNVKQNEIIPEEEKRNETKRNIMALKVRVEKESEGEKSKKKKEINQDRDEERDEVEVEKKRRGQQGKGDELREVSKEREKE